MDADLDSILDESSATEGTVRPGIVGYPSHPIYAQLAHMLQVWMDTRWAPGILPCKRLGQALVIGVNDAKNAMLGNKIESVQILGETYIKVHSHYSV